MAASWRALGAATIVAIFFLQSLPSDADAEGGDGEGPVVIGKYVQFGGDHDLTEEHADISGDSVTISAPPFSSRLKVKTAWLDEKLTDWATDVSFHLDEHERTIVDAEQARFFKLDLNAEPVFTRGSSESVRFLDRPMWIAVEPYGEGSLKLDLHDGDATGQKVLLNVDWLRANGIHRPIASYASGEAIPVIETADDNFIVDAPHFSFVILSPAELDVRGKVGTTWINPHPGSRLWDISIKRLDITVAAQATSYQVWVERAWVDVKIPSLGLRGHEWTVQQTDSKDFYVVSLEASETPTTLTFEPFVPNSISTYTRGNATNVQILAGDSVALEAKDPLSIRLEAGAHPRLMIEGSGRYVMELGAAWLTSLGYADPTFLVGAAAPYHFKRVDNGNWVILLDDGGAVDIVDGAALADPRGRVKIADLSGAAPAPEDFTFEPTSYNALSIFDSSRTLDQFQPPRSLVLSEIGTLGAYFDPIDYPSLGMGADFLPTDVAEPYTLGIWLDRADLHALRQGLDANLAVLLAERTASPPFEIMYGWPKLPVAGDEDQWAARSGTQYTFGNPYAAGPVKDRLGVPLSTVAGALIACALVGGCGNVSTLQFWIYEDGVRNMALEGVASGVLTAVADCIEFAGACPVSDTAVVDFANGYRAGLEAGTFASQAGLTVEVRTALGLLVDCAPCGTEAAVVDLLEGTRAMALDHNDGATDFLLTRAAGVALGCLDPITYVETNSTLPECQDEAVALNVDDIFPLIDPGNPLQCIEEEVMGVLTLFTGVLHGYVSIHRPDIEECWGYMDVDVLGSELLEPDLGEIFGACDIVPLDATTADCNGNLDAAFMLNVNPLGSLIWYPFCGYAYVCQAAAMALAMDEMYDHAGKLVGPESIITSPLYCRDEGLYRAALSNHDEMHARGNAAFYLTFGPHYCVDIDENSAHAGLIVNSPITSHNSPAADDYVAPPAIYVMSALAWRLTTHEFGHAFALEHEDGKCWSGHWFRSHASHMMYTGDPKTNDDCQGRSVYRRHLHKTFDAGEESIIAGSITAWENTLEDTHAPLDPP